MSTIWVFSQGVQLLHSIKHTDGIFDGPGDFIIADISGKTKSNHSDMQHCGLSSETGDAAKHLSFKAPQWGHGTAGQMICCQRHGLAVRTLTIWDTMLPQRVTVRRHCCSDEGEANWPCLALGQLMGPVEARRGRVFTRRVTGAFVSVSTCLATSERTSSLSVSPLPYRLAG